MFRDDPRQYANMRSQKMQNPESNANFRGKFGANKRKSAF